MVGATLILAGLAEVYFCVNKGQQKLIIPLTYFQINI
jgi:hypothetical protein